VARAALPSADIRNGSKTRAFAVLLLCLTAGLVNGVNTVSREELRAMDALSSRGSLWQCYHT
jgi:hypothetical protein